MVVWERERIDGGLPSGRMIDEPSRLRELMGGLMAGPAAAGRIPRERAAALPCARDGEMGQWPSDKSRRSDQSPAGRGAAWLSMMMGGLPVPHDE